MQKVVTEAESERRREGEKGGEGGKCEGGLSRREEEQRAREATGKACPSPRGLTWTIRQVGGAKVVGSRLSLMMEGLRTWRGRSKVEEPSGMKIGCPRSQREKHFLRQLLKNLSECTFKWIVCLCFWNGGVPGDASPTTHPPTPHQAVKIYTCFSLQVVLPANYL